MRHHFKRWPEETNTGLNQPETTQFDCYDLLSSNTLTYVRGGPDPWQLPVDEALDGYERQLQVPKLLWTMDFEGDFSLQWKSWRYWRHSEFKEGKLNK